MDFSEAFETTGKVVFSPCGRYLAHVKARRLRAFLREAPINLKFIFGHCRSSM